MSPIRPVVEPLRRPVRMAVLISGGGRTLMNFSTRIAAGALSAEIPLVIADRPCRGIQLATEAGYACELIQRSQCADSREFGERIFQLCRQAKVDLVAMAGFLSLLPIPDDFSLRVMNIHPSLIPAFCGAGYYGLRVHQAALERGVKFSGCTVHFADNQYDHGPIILQQPVPVLDDDTPETLAARVFEAECEAYPEAVRLFGEGRLEVDGLRVRHLPPRTA